MQQVIAAALGHAGQAGIAGAGAPCRCKAPATEAGYSDARYFPSSHSETWMRYSSHSRRLSST
jgi:hypothetical protein